MIYRKVNLTEYPVLAEIHINAFDDFFLTSLGKRFLMAYYKASLRSPESIAVCAINEKNEMVGFGIGCKQSRGYHKRLVKKNLLLFMFQGFVILFTRPKAIFRLASNLDKNASETDNGNYAELLSIGVLPGLKGAGIGKEMITKFEKEAELKGCKKIALTTDYNNNEDVIAFYKKRGYRIFYDFYTYPKRRMYKMIKILHE